MPTYFKPLRRKIGVVTLVLACVSAVAMSRSYFIDDMIQGQNAHFEYYLESCYGGVVVQIILWDNDKEVDPQDHYFEWTNENASPIYPRTSAPMLERLGFRYSRIMTDSTRLPRNGNCIHNLTFPYWSIVIPLTMLSAWLLLSKPRAGKHPEK